MNTEWYLNPEGLLGTGASLLADLTLLAYIFLIVPAMLVGFVFARRKMFRPHHKYTMITITVVNWILILLLMVAAYRFDVADNIGEKPGNSRYLFPTIHALLGFGSQILATSLIFRMLREESQIAAAKKRGETTFSRYYARNIKPQMRLTLALWLITSTLGVISYLTRYDVIPTLGADDPDDTIIVTPEVTPETTPEPMPEVTPAATPESTPEITPEPAGTPEFTPEPDDDDDDRNETPEPEDADDDRNETPEPDDNDDDDRNETPEPDDNDDDDNDDN